MKPRCLSDCINKELVDSLREKRAAGANVIELLNEIKHLQPEDISIQLLCMTYFREAFDLSLIEAAPLSGWCGFGGDLSDEKIIECIEPYLK